jgi:hypothetical protein
MDTPPAAPKNRVYRLAWWQRAFGIVFLAFSLCFVPGLGIRLMNQNSEIRPIELIVAVIFPVAGAAITFNVFTSTVSFSKDSVRLHSILHDKTIPIHVIRGRKERVVRDYYVRTRYLVLISNDDRVPSLEFMKEYSFDEEFYRWFYSLLDLDSEARKEHKDKDFGLV